MTHGEHENPFPDSKWRTCHRCQKTFWSLSKGNRRCNKCESAIENTYRRGIFGFRRSGRKALEA
jgi:protein-arginine kinase activator protein McsA